MSQLWEWVTLGIPRLQMRVRLSTHLTRHHNRKTLAGISSKPLNQTHKLPPQKGWAIKVTQRKPLGNICMAPSRATHQLHLACPTEQLPHSHTPPIRLLPFSHLPEHQLPSSAPSDAIPHQFSLARSVSQASADPPGQLQIPMAWLPPFTTIRPC